MHTSTLSKTQTKTCVTGCLTRCREAEAFCSWLPISSINSLPSTHPTPLHPSPPYSHRPGLNGRHDYVATRRHGNHLLGNEPRCLQAGTTLWQLWEDKSISKIGGNLLCFSFSPFFFKINLFTAFSQTRRTKKISILRRLIKEHKTPNYKLIKGELQEKLWFNVRLEIRVRDWGMGTPKHTWKHSALLSHNLELQTHPKDLESSLYLCYG